ncbi:hypothetical protein AVEN_194805-1 [Araneus ventricosus]|uniref:Uncharacterized protein n=1 Tax=Araneus ventricosus TaxID=182803 RepID=A0A4Y2B411_ARAVE|nr:hypothetical protein AVEN_194805-1 [Araneus ventricosus]
MCSSQRAWTGPGTKVTSWRRTLRPVGGGHENIRTSWRRPRDKSLRRQDVGCNAMTWDAAIVGNERSWWYATKDQLENVHALSGMKDR